MAPEYSLGPKNSKPDGLNLNGSQNQSYFIPQDQVGNTIKLFIIINGVLIQPTGGRNSGGSNGRAKSFGRLGSIGNHLKYF